MKDIHFHEYHKRMPGAVRKRDAQKCNIAVIPAVVVENVRDVNTLADCFVHVDNINTTFYIDDKHRSLITWAGPVEVDDYDYENNPLGLRSQFAIDFRNNRAIYYNKIGKYKIISLGDM